MYLLQLSFFFWCWFHSMAVSTVRPKFTSFMLITSKNIILPFKRHFTFWPFCPPYTTANRDLVVSVPCKFNEGHIFQARMFGYIFHGYPHIYINFILLLGHVTRLSSKQTTYLSRADRAGNVWYLSVCTPANSLPQFWARSRAILKYSQIWLRTWILDRLLHLSVNTGERSRCTSRILVSSSIIEMLGECSSTPASIPEWWAVSDGCR